MRPAKTIKAASFFLKTALLLLAVLAFSGFRPAPATRYAGAPFLNFSFSAPLPFDPARPDDSLSTVVPFNKLGNLIVLQASVDGVQGNFILDTGAPHLVLNLTYFRNHAVQVVAGETHTSVGGAASLVQKTAIRRFSIGAMEYYQQEADLVDLGAVENSKGIKVMGLIGYELLRQCEVIIDYEAGLIYFHRIGRREGARYNSPHLQQDAAFATQSIDVQNSQILLQGQMRGKKMKFVLDSGAETAILDSRLPESLLNTVTVVGRMTVKGTGTNSVEALRGEAEGLRLGAEAIDKLPVLIASLEGTCFAQNLGVNGVLGLEFMKLRKIGFNFITRKMYLWK